MRVNVEGIPTVPIFLLLPKNEQALAYRRYVIPAKVCVISATVAANVLSGLPRFLAWTRHWLRTDSIAQYNCPSTTSILAALCFHPTVKALRHSCRHGKGTLQQLSLQPGMPHLQHLGYAQVKVGCHHKGGLCKGYVSRFLNAWPFIDEPPSSWTCARRTPMRTPAPSYRDIPIWFPIRL